jgi:hypothetical protein
MNKIKRIIIGMAFGMSLGIAFLIIMLTEGSYIAYVPHK